MQKIHVRIFIACLVILGLSAAGLSAADDPLAIDPAEEKARSSFDTFTIDWMRKVGETEDMKRTIEEADDGFIAQYVKYLPTRYTVVKTTKSKETPFVGILTYYARTFQCLGKTRDDALSGPFKELHTKQVSEIFRYTRGKWVY